MPTQAERSEATRRALLAAARRLFAGGGYEATSIEDISRAAGVTRGALYHHFESKTDVFRSVFEEAQGWLAGRVAAAARAEPDAWSRLGAAIRAYLVEVSEPGLRRIVLVDGPLALGWAEWRRIDERHFLGGMRHNLSQAIAEGSIAPRPVEPLARLILGAATEAALSLGLDGERRVTVDDVVAEMARLLRGLTATTS
jgi:AcrR family transcriptional regulator